MNPLAFLFAAETAGIPRPSAVAEWIPLLMILVPAGQAIWMEFMRRRDKDTKVVVGEVKDAVADVKVAVAESKEATVVLEKQINSNLEKQIEASINKAIANERLHAAGLPEARNSVITAEATADAKKAQSEKAHGTLEERLKTSEERLAALEKKGGK